MKGLNLESITTKITPLVNKFSQHKWVKAISSGFTYVIPFTLVAAIFTIIATPPVTESIIAEGGFYGNLMSGWFNFSQEYKDILTVPANMTTGLISLVSVMGISFTLAKELKMKNQLTAVINAVIMFMIVASPVTMGVLASVLANVGDPEMIAMSMTNVMDVAYLGAQGLFVAIIISIASVEILNLCINKNITIRFGESVPEVVAAPFKAFIPVLINFIIFYGLSVLVNVTLDTTLPKLIIDILMPAIGNVNTIWGILIIVILDHLLWFFGIHGGAVTMMLYMPLAMQLTAENAGIVAAGGTAIWHPVFASAVSSAYIGLNLAILIVGKSQKLKAVGKIAIVPDLFNINEPLIFGTPMIYNMWLLIPGVLIPVIQVTVLYLIGSMGLLSGPYNLLMVNLPMGFNEFFSTMSFMNVLFVVGIQLAGTLLWIPFVKMYDKQLVVEEAQELEEQNQN